MMSNQSRISLDPDTGTSSNTESIFKFMCFAEKCLLYRRAKSTSSAKSDYICRGSQFGASS